MTRQHEYSRSPLDILIDRESRTCKGCKHVISMMCFGNLIHACQKGKKKRNRKCYEETFGPTCKGGK